MNLRNSASQRSAKAIRSAVRPPTGRATRRHTRARRSGSRRSAGARGTRSGTRRTRAESVTGNPRRDARAMVRVSRPRYHPRPCLTRRGSSRSCSKVAPCASSRCTLTTSTAWPRSHSPEPVAVDARPARGSDRPRGLAADRARQRRCRDRAPVRDRGARLGPCDRQHALPEHRGGAPPVRDRLDLDRGPAQRSGANREAKLLQLEHGFERLGANRIEFKTDSLNEKSRTACSGSARHSRGPSATNGHARWSPPPFRVLQRHS